jgi:hypothetical protein
MEEMGGVSQGSKLDEGDDDESDDGGDMDDQIQQDVEKWEAESKEP